MLDGGVLGRVSDGLARLQPLDVVDVREDAPNRLGLVAATVPGRIADDVDVALEAGPEALLLRRRAGPAAPARRMMRPPREAARGRARSWIPIASVISNSRAAVLPSSRGSRSASSCPAGTSSCRRAACRTPALRGDWSSASPARRGTRSRATRDRDGHSTSMPPRPGDHLADALLDGRSAATTRAAVEEVAFLDEDRGAAFEQDDRLQPEALVSMEVAARDLRRA